MRLYTVLQGPEPGTAGDDLVFVKEGFCWPALLVPLVWLVWRRLWLVLLAVLGLWAALDLVARVAGLPPALTAMLSYALVVVLGFEGNELRRWSLRRRGWVDVAVVGGRTLAEAEHRFFSAFAVTASGMLMRRERPA